MAIINGPLEDSQNSICGLAGHADHERKKWLSKLGSSAVFQYDVLVNVIKTPLLMYWRRGSTWNEQMQINA